MRVKPNGFWYILPLLIVGIGFFVMFFQFFSAISIDGLGVTTLELDEEYTVEMEADSMIAMYVEQQFGYDYLFHIENGTILLDYTNWMNETHSIEIVIQKLPSGDILEGYNLEPMDVEDIDSDEDYFNFADIDIQEQGTYLVVFHSEENIDFELGVQPIDISALGEQFGQIGLTIILTLSLSIGSSLLILLMRSKSKKRINLYRDQNNYSNQYYAERQQERIDSNKQNKY